MKQLLRIFFFFFCSSSPLLGKENFPPIDRHKFDNVLLIVNFNHPYYESIPFIRFLYQPLFPHIVFYGEKPDPEVQTVDLYFGVYSIRTLADALSRFPQYEGYLFLQDDCMMNPWNYADLDLDKLWLAVSRYPYPGSYQNSPPPSWLPDFDKKMGQLDFLHASLDGKYREHWGWWVPHVYGLAAIQKAAPFLPAAFQAQLEKNVGKNMAVAQTCDMFYIPARFRKESLQLCRIFWDVFYEISVPMMFCCLDSMENWEFLRMFWGFTQEHFLDYDPSYHWIHPLKFSGEKHRNFVSEKLQSYYKTLPE